MSLYPPIVEPYLPGFPSNATDFTVPYSISPYQDELPTNVHVKILKINTNVSVLDKTKAASGYLNLKYDGSYRIRISTNDANIITNQYYKVQIRFANKTKKSEWSSICLIKFIEVPELVLQGWDVDNIDAVCNIPIENPYVYRVRGGFQFKSSATVKDAVFQEDYIKFYRIKFYNGFDTTDDENLQYDSGNITPAEKNIIDHSFPYALSVNSAYAIKIEYISHSFYSNHKTFKLMTTDMMPNSFRGSATAVENMESASIDVTVVMPKSEILFGNYMIKRASDKDGFVIWEPVHIFSFDVEKYRDMVDSGQEIPSQFPIEVWKDYAIESGVFYRYSVHFYKKGTSTGGESVEDYIGPPVPVYNNYNELREQFNENQLEEWKSKIDKTDGSGEQEDGIAVDDQRYVYGVGTSPAVTLYLDNIVLFDGKRQLKIQYNPEISSFQRNILETKTDTLGAKYPFVRRNASMNYRSFQLSGLISYHMNTGFFESSSYDHYKESIFGSVMEHKNSSDAAITGGFVPLIEKDNGNFLTTPHRERRNMTSKEREVFKEKIFREEVMDFLYKDQIKLFKSETEGTMLVKIMNISLTPENQLGRMIYSFSAEMVEIDKCSFQNFQKYGLINLGEYDYDLGDYDTKAGQARIDFSSFDFTDDNNNAYPLISDGLDIAPFIKRKLIKKNSNLILTSFSSFEFLKIIFESEPYLIRIKDGAYSILKKGVPVSEEGVCYVKGHLLSIQDQYIIVKDKIFQLEEGDGLSTVIDNQDTLTLSSVIKVYGLEPTDTVEVDYVVNLNFNPNLYKDYTNSYSKVGQIWDNFENGSTMDSLLIRLAQKYNFIDTSDKFSGLSAINAIEVEAAPGTVVMIKDSSGAFDDSQFYEHMVGATGRLFYFDENKIIKDCYIKGLKLTPALEKGTKRFQPRDGEYKIIKVNSFEEVNKDNYKDTNVLFYKPIDSEEDFNPNKTYDYFCFYCKGVKTPLIEEDSKNKPIQKELFDTLKNYDTGNSGGFYEEGELTKQLPALYVDYPSDVLFNFVIEIEEGAYKRYY